MMKISWHWYKTMRSQCGYGTDANFVSQFYFSIFKSSFYEKYVFYFTGTGCALPSVPPLKSGTWKAKKWWKNSDLKSSHKPAKLNHRNVFPWRGRLMVRHCLPVILITLLEYGKSVLRLINFEDWTSDLTYCFYKYKRYFYWIKVYGYKLRVFCWMCMIFIV